MAAPTHTTYTNQAPAPPLGDGLRCNRPNLLPTLRRIHVAINPSRTTSGLKFADR